MCVRIRNVLRNVPLLEKPANKRYVCGDLIESTKQKYAHRLHRLRSKPAARHLSIAQILQNMCARRKHMLARARIRADSFRILHGTYVLVCVGLEQSIKSI